MRKFRLIMMIVICFTLVFNVAFVGAVDASKDHVLPFILRNENFAFEERTAAVIIDAGKEVDRSSLSAEDFTAHVVLTRKVDPSIVYYDGPRDVVDVYTSEVNDWGYPSDSGRYIVLDFPHVGWGDGGTTNDGGYTFDAEYTIGYTGTQIEYTDGSSVVPDGFVQTGVVSPVLDKYQYASFEGQDYSYFMNEEADEPLPLVVYFHGGGQGNDIYTPARFSNGGTVWANPENQAKYPCHVLVPRNASNVTAMARVKGIIDAWIADGKVDPNRIYMTGYSMGSFSTWTFLRTYPDYVAAAVYGAGGGPTSMDIALSTSYLPQWFWVDEGDFFLNSVINTDNTYGPYLYDYMLTILPEVTLYDYPYNGWTFSGHSSWLVAYNEYVDPDRGSVIEWFFNQSKIRGIEEVAVSTLSGVAPVLPETVAVDVNYNATGIATEDRAVVWDEIDPWLYGNDGPGVFTVEGAIEGCVEKAVATVTVEYNNRLADLMDWVNDLDIVRGSKIALWASLNNAARLIDLDNANPSISNLEAFISKVENFVRIGRLDAEIAADMIFAAEETIRYINDQN